MPTSKILMLVLLVLAGIYAVSVSIYTNETDQSPVKTARQNTKALIGGPFSLVDHHGKNVTQEDFRGKYMLLYFGYTYCPDICPMELQIMSDALDQIPAEILTEITPLFITVDPARDTVDNLALYVQSFHEKLIGLTGNEQQITAVKKVYRVYAAREKQGPDEDPDAYLVSHTSYIYLMDRSGKYVTHFKSRTDPQVMAERLREIVGND